MTKPLNMSATQLSATEQIRFGLSNLRNPALASHAFHILPYRGLGSGIKRAIDAWPHIEFLDERDANLFRVIIKRPEVQAEEVNEIMSGKMSGKIVAALLGNPNLTIPELANTVGVTTRTIERTLSTKAASSVLVRPKAATGKC